MIEKLSFLSHPNCYQIANELVDLVVSTDFGPRILRYGFAGKENILGGDPHGSVPTPWGDWKPRMGHRLWVAPEEMPASYALDDAPLKVEMTGDHRVCLTQPVDRAGFEKQITVELAHEGTGVQVHHQITNRNAAAVRVAPWALTIMRGGGVAFVPLEPFRSHDECVSPVSSIILWSYTDLTDPRLTFGRKLLRLRSDPAKTAPQKIGALNQQGWCAYHHPSARTLFIKSVSWEAGATYPDLGANTETYTAGDFIELETLGPLTNLAPGHSVTHLERWHLFQDVSIGERDEEAERTLRKYWDNA